MGKDAEAAPDGRERAFEAAAQQLFAEHERGAPFRGFASSSGIASLDDAYAVQAAFVRELRRAGRGGPVGYKIGLTSKRMQEMCGIDSPLAGVILDGGLHASGVELSLKDYGRLGLEFEICIVMGRDLPTMDRRYTTQEIAAAVRSVAASVELIDDRNCDYDGLDAPSLIADNSWNAGAVLGEPMPAGADIVDCEGIVMRDGQHLDRGYGRDVLGGPLVPLEWLVNHLNHGGQGLNAGDIVMTGSLIPTQFPTGPCRYHFFVAGIGQVDVGIVD